MPRIVHAGLCAVALLVAGCGGHSGPHTARDQLSFGVSMAQEELWSEAYFRFQQADRLQPQDPRVLNNLAVASEALGRFEQALDHYRQALALSPNDADLRHNYDRFVGFYEAYRAREEKVAEPTPEPEAPEPEAPEAPATAAEDPPERTP
ncbi:MAG TPA: tetratricopeptide repeat protein [Thermoanaerobaculia bacterium]|nr:tetratricopeptide repeat protein [Thermoanaerobaculia bacterium]